jgi:hypothetical protein
MIAMTLDGLSSSDMVASPLPSSISAPDGIDSCKRAITVYEARDDFHGYDNCFP